MALEDNAVEQAEDFESETEEVQDDDFELIEIETEDDEEESEAEQNNSEEAEEESTEDEVDIESDEDEESEESPTSEEDDEEANSAPKWVKELRKSDRTKTAEIKRLQKELEEAKKITETPPESLVKPTLEDFDYDSEQYEKALIDWTKNQAEVAKQKEKALAEQQAQEEQWNATLQNYAESKQRLKAKNYNVAEEAVQNGLDVNMQAIILQVADDPALVVLALGNNPQKLKQLSSINDPLKFAKQLTLFETKIRVKKKGVTPPPERSIKGRSAVSVTTDKKLAQLQAEADRTGNRSKVVAYLRSQRQNA